MTYSINRYNRYIARSAALAICLAPALVFAQQNSTATTSTTTPSAVSGQQAADANGADPSAVVIVTGVTKSTTKKNATFSINTLTAEEIQRLAPMSTAEMLANFPGIYTEGGSAGEASNNICLLYTSPSPRD